LKKWFSSRAGGVVGFENIVFRTPSGNAAGVNDPGYNIFWRRRDRLMTPVEKALEGKFERRII
jgi:hypothetical protein